MIGLPLVSILMFILAGVLIGHLLWYHDRKADQRRISKLEDRYQLVRGTAVRRKQEFARLQSEVSSHQHLLDQTRAETNDALLRQQQADEQARVAKQQLLQMQHEQRELSERLDEETRRSESVVAQLKEALQAKTKAEQCLAESAQSNASTEEIADTYRARIEELQQQNIALSEEHAQEIQSIRAEVNQTHDEVIENVRAEISQTHEQEIERLRSELVEAHEEEIEKLRAVVTEQAAAAAQTTRDKEGAIIRLKDELQSQQKSHTETNQAIESVQHKIESLSAELQAVQTDRERLNTALNEKSESLLLLQQSHDDMTKDSEARIYEISSQLADTNRKLQEITTKYNVAVEDLSQRHAEADHLNEKIQQFESLQTQLEQANETIAQQQTRLEKQAEDLAHQQEQLAQHVQQAQAKESQIAELRQQEQELLELRESVKEIGELKVERETLTNQLADAKSTREQLAKVIATKESKIIELSKVVSEFDATKQQLAESKQQVAVLAADRQKLDQSYQALREQSESLQQQLSEGGQTIRALQEQLAAKDQQVSEATSRVRETTLQLERRSEAASKLSQQLAAAEQLRPVNHDLQQRLDELTKRLAVVTAEHEDSLQSNAKAEDRVRDLQNQLHEYAEKIRDQRRKLAATGELPTDNTANEGRRAA
tara:strand:+ start:420879 stop:422855 length:1977 start_codon:yes stop_codon:yes gene_type:complete